MKKISLIVISLLCVIASEAQVVNSKFKPLSYSYDELVMAAQAQAIRNQQREEKFEQYQDLAYEYYNKGDYNGFIYYSNMALETGWYNSKLFYDRGMAYERLIDYKKAKKEYKKAIKKGYYPANDALESCKRTEKIWKQNR